MKKSKSKKKSDHKHIYRLEKIDDGWFTHEKKCEICGHINNRLRIEEPSINAEKMKEFVDFFDEEIFPKIKGENGEGLNHFRELVRLRRLEVEEKKIKREERKTEIENNVSRETSKEEGCQ